MNLPDFNIAKFSIPVSIRRAFDRGEVDKSYREMYKVADELASADAKRYEAQKMAEYRDSHRVRGHPGVGELPSIVPVKKQVLDYRNGRLEYHMQNMIHMLELYVASRQKEQTQENIN